MDPAKYVRDYNEVLKFSVEEGHRGFQTLIAKHPAEATHRAVYADWLEENDPQSVSPETLTFLRSHQGPAWVQHGTDGKVYGGRKWTLKEIRKSEGDRAKLAMGGGDSWFSPRNMRLFHTTLLPNEVHHGPGGVYFIHQDAEDPQGQDYRVSMFNEKQGRVNGLTGNVNGMPTTHADLNAAREVAQTLARTPKSK